MIFYFSATGNSQHVAKRIAKATHDERTYSITECMKNKEFSFELFEEESLGIISPTYCWGLPIIVKKFLQNVQLSGNPVFIWFVATYGTTPGQIGYFANQILQTKGNSFSAYFGVKMPDTWTPIFDLSNKELVNEINAKAEIQIDSIIEKIKMRATGDFMQGQLPRPIARLFYPIGYSTMRKTKHFHVDDTCTRCGLCVRVCPISAIDLDGAKPTWNTKECVMCLSCLHRCPTFSIQYGSRTKKHGQYVHE